MANIVEKTLTLVYGMAKNNFSGSGINLDYQGWNQQPMAIWNSKNGTATMNSTGKSALYPKAGLHPIKADYTMIGAASVDGAHLSIQIDGISIFEGDYPNDSKEYTTSLTDQTLPAIINSTSNSSITFNLTATSQSLFGGFGVRNNSFMTFYFQQWDLLGYSTGDGVQIVLSPGRLYEGETGTFSTLINENSTFHGWYKDAEHTQLVSTEQTYIVTASEDLTLYAYTTKKQDKYNNQIYFKGNSNKSLWKHPYSIYKKTINGWELQTNISINNKNYTFAGNAIKHEITNTTHRIRTNVSSYPHVVYFLENNLQNRLFTSISSSTSFYFVPIEEGLALVYNGNYNTTTQTLTVSWYDTTEYLTRTMTIQATPQTTTQKIYFIDKDGNSYTETKQSNQAYTVVTPEGYNNFIGWQEKYNGQPTGRVLQVGESYYDVGHTSTIVYEPLFNE